MQQRTKQLQHQLATFGAKKGNNTVPEEVKNGIRSNIKSIPRVEAHYVRADTNKEYISQWGLSVTALYRKYIEQCEAD